MRNKRNMRNKQKYNKKQSIKNSCYDDSCSFLNDYDECDGKIKVDYDRRVLYITGDITFEMSDEFVRIVDKLENLNNKCITIKMSSCGGEIEAALSIYDRINDSKLKVNFIGYSTIMSAALIIMCCCDNRKLYENTRLMWHPSSADMSYRDARKECLEIETKEMCFLEDKTNKVLSEHSAMSYKFWSKIKNELYFSADEALQMNLIDGVIKGTRHNFIENKSDTKFEQILMQRCRC